MPYLSTELLGSRNIAHSHPLLEATYYMLNSLLRYTWQNDSTALAQSNLGPNLPTRHNSTSTSSAVYCRQLETGFFKIYPTLCLQGLLWPSCVCAKYFVARVQADPREDVMGKMVVRVLTGEGSANTHPLTCPILPHPHPVAFQIW